MKKKETVKNDVDVFDFFSKNSSVYVGVRKDFVDKVRILIIGEYKTLANFNRKFLKIDYPNLKHEFQKAKYHSLTRWIIILKAFEVNKEELFENITCFRLNGSHAKSAIVLPRIITLDTKFMEGYSLYLAEGDTGLSGKKTPAKLRFTNANLDVIKFFIDWLRCYFSGNNFYVNAIIPGGINTAKDFLKNIGEKLHVSTSVIKPTVDYYNKIVKYRVCWDSKMIIDLVLSLDRVIKIACKNDKALAVGYIKGIMAGEGTVYFNKSRYVRIEMRNEKEIKYVHSLLQNLGYDCKVTMRKERVGMCSIYIGVRQLRRFHDEIGFGSELKRQNLLKLAVDKKLRVNQVI